MLTTYEMDRLFKDQEKTKLQDAEKQRGQQPIARKPQAAFQVASSAIRLLSHLATAHK